MTETAVLSQDRQSLRILHLNRPQRLNALNEAMKKELMAALGRAKGDEAVRVVIITGKGRAFSAGADLEGFSQLYDAKDPEQIERFTDLAFPRAFWDFPKPLIAAVNGPAVGWGMTMPLLCDLRLASTQARFSCGFLRVGVTPEFGSSCLLPRILGLGRALELVLSAREVEAGEALAIGLVSEVTDPENLLERACRIGEVMASFPPQAVQEAKALLHRGAQSSLEEMWEPEIKAFRQAMNSPEHRQAVAEMIAKLNAGKGKTPA